MSFLEAHRVASELTGGEPLSFLLAASGELGQLNTYLKAHAAKRGRAAAARTLAFNTLAQALLAPATPGEREVFLLLPWDLSPALDWRSGIPADGTTLDEVRLAASEVASRLSARPNAQFLYLAAPIPPVFHSRAEQNAACDWLASLAWSIGARALPADAFQLGSYLASGCAIGGQRLSAVAELVIEMAIGQRPARRKVLVTDFDETLWSGIVGEDGPDGVLYRPEGKGFRHFIYQTHLAKLRREGVLLAGVSRNDPEIALAPIRSGRMTLKEDDFVVVMATYLAKSAQIRAIAEQLNLGLDAFVFVDDNPIEVEEVSRQLPGVTCFRFPASDDALGTLLTELATLFETDAVTAEDRERTAMYRTRVVGIAPSAAAGADLTSFLRGLDMSLTIHDRSRGDRTRAVQLINKTNQFNLNGRRVEHGEVAAILAAGGRLYTASLADRHGTHGEILSCLIDADGTVESLVLSCRVFQRCVEHAFLAWLGMQPQRPRALHFAVTPRNEPIRQFLAAAGIPNEADGTIAFDAAGFTVAHADAIALFRLTVPSDESVLPAASASLAPAS
jgi:FkbH-like protein